MPIYEIRPSELAQVEETSLQREGLTERGDLQRLLVANIGCLAPGLMVLAEEFSGWADSARRIDILCLDQEANLVVVELKRELDGGHMDLQALRYAAMVSNMTFQHAVSALARHLGHTTDKLDDARQAILAFLDWSTPDEDAFANDTRVILAAPGFDKEITTTVLWLRERDIDVRCIRLKPYRLGDGRVLLDIQPLIPLPETSEFVTTMGEKRIAERKDRAERLSVRYEFWGSLLAYARTRTDIHAGRQASTDGWVSGPAGRQGLRLNYVIKMNEARVELWIERNKDAFKALQRQQADIEREFGGPLDWDELPDAAGARVSSTIPGGGYRSAREEWPLIQERMVDAMVRLDRAMRSRVTSL